MKTRFTIIGGGVAGLTAAIALRQLGLSVEVYERASELKGIGAGFGLAANAMQAFSHLVLREGVESVGHFLDSYNILSQQGEVLVEPDTKRISNKFNERNFAIHRADLHLFLRSQLPTEVVHLGKEAIRMEQNHDSILLDFSDGSRIETDALIIADGVKSKLRQQLIPASKPRYSGYTCWRAIVDNSSMQHQQASETWGTKGRFGMTPLVGDRVYWYACINARENNTTYANYKVADLLANFKDYHAPIPRIIAETKDEQLLWNYIIDIAPLDNLAYGNVLLIGDAGHATTPNIGQGACQAIEDVAVLQDELRDYHSVADAFLRFSDRRLARTRYITKTSWQIGKIAQWENPTLISARNFLMRLMPERLKQMQLRKLLNEDFMAINKR